MPFFRAKIKYHNLFPELTPPDLSKKCPPLTPDPIMWMRFSINIFFKNLRKYILPNFEADSLLCTGAIIAVLLLDPAPIV